MIRERAFKTVLVVVGLFFTSLVYPVALDLRHLYAEDPGDTMMKGLYVTLGIFLLLAARNPAAHRSLIGFAAWSSFAHAVVMSVLAFGPTYVNDRRGYWEGSAVLVAIGVALLALSPAQARKPASATAAWGTKTTA
jgi:hypothetical protein